jgi:plastocyanin
MTRPLLAVTFIATLAVGCGNEAERSDAPPAKAAETATAAPSAASKASASETVAIKGFTYDPARVSVRSGGEVTWENEDASNHTVTFKKKGGPEDVGNLREGRSASVTFEKRGSYAYICEFHPGMAGTVEVR